MTAFELLRQGYVFERCEHGRIVGVLSPPGMDTVPDEVMQGVSAEIARRVEMMADPPRVDVPVTAGKCDACGDPMSRGRGGWCEFCVVARKKALAKHAR